MRISNMMTTEVLADAVPAVNKMAALCNKIAPQIIKILDGAKIIKRLAQPTKVPRLKLEELGLNTKPEGVTWWLEYNAHDIYLSMHIWCKGVPGGLRASKRLMLLDFHTQICSQKPQALTLMPIHSLTRVIGQQKRLTKIEQGLYITEQVAMEVRCELAHFIS